MRAAPLSLLLLVAPLAGQGNPVINPVISIPPITTTISPMINMDLDLARLGANLESKLSGLTTLQGDLEWRNLDLMTHFNSDFNYQINHELNSAFTTLSGFGGGIAPAPWAKDDPADSLYRIARESLNRGDYRRASTQFDDLQKKFPKSVYAKDAPYWQAFALYRLGSTSELTQALAILDKWRTDNPPAPAGTGNKNTVNSRNGFRLATDYSWGSAERPDVDGLSARIAGVLSSRGMSDNAAVKKALAATGTACDTEDLAVKAEALSALMRNSAEQGQAAAAKILARRDECSASLRRNALLVLAERNAAASAPTIIATAKNDPSTSVRLEAISWLGRVPGDDALNTLEELTRSTDASVQRAAVQALGSSTNAAAREKLRSIIGRPEVSENLRTSALDAFGTKGASAADAAMLQGMYGKESSVRMKERIVSAIARIGGDANDQWLLSVAQREDEPSSVRSTILSRLGRTMEIPALSKFYDTANSRDLRESIISQLASRSEPTAVDKLIDIAKNGTDPTMRRQAISALSRSKDPRAAKLLLDLVDR